MNSSAPVQAPTDVLVVGGGGREHALAWKLAASPRCASIRVAPGNGGTPGERVRLAATDATGIAGYCRREGIGLVVVGPEAALAAGVVDELHAVGVPAFGPTAANARLETSKAFTRALAAELAIPSPRYAVFGDAPSALHWWRTLGAPVVVKLSGLAAGKGVIVPGDDAQCEEAIRTLAAEGEIVVEERLRGPECSLLALCDGRTAVALPLAQDHKRIGAGDTGPNTGGMGAYAPAPVPYGTEELTATFVQPVLDHLAAQGSPYVGVLFAGLMLTPDGPRLLEYNCRFGDPEAQAVLPLVDDDLLEVLLACCEGRLAERPVRIARDAAACTVVAAAAGYPRAPVLGMPVHLPPDPSADALVFHAGTETDEHDGLVVAGGRVLAVTGLGGDLVAARAAAYAALEGVRFEGMQVRPDIAWRAPGAQLGGYAAAGVDIDEGNRAVAEMRASVERTHGPAVLAGVGSFGGALDASALKDYDQPVLVASTDGVGTKVELAARAGRPASVGADIVNHCVDDVLVQGARPLFFLDYVAAATLDAGVVAALVGEMAEACVAAGCVLLGGETAEMPGVYAPGAFDIAGTLVGVVERAAMLPRPGVAAGDVLVGLASSGPHTNGYSLLRRLFQWLPLDAQPEPLDVPLGDALLAPHRSYLGVLAPVLDHPGLKALAHITGGGLPENLVRVLPAGVGAVVDTASWPLPPLFRLVRDVAVAMPPAELYRTLNMGIGMVAVCAPEHVAAIRDLLGEETWVIGELIDGERTVTLR